jgi:hypothetical protein
MIRDFAHAATATTRESRCYQPAAVRPKPYGRLGAMDIDRFWDLIGQARAEAGGAADAPLRELDVEDEDPAREYWDFDELDPDVLRANVGLEGPDAATDPGLDPDFDEEDGEDDDDLTDPVALALVRVLARLEPAEIAKFELAFDHVRAAADRDDLANAAVLIEHGFLGDDSFDDFRAGLVALGRETYEKALSDPDSLADHPAVREIATAADPRWLGREDLLYAASRAYAEATGRDEVTFFDAVEALEDDEQDVAGQAADGWDITDEAETRRRLPRLAARFFERSMANRSRALARLAGH